MNDSLSSKRAVPCHGGELKFCGGHVDISNHNLCCRLRFQGFANIFYSRNTCPSLDLLPSLHAESGGCVPLPRATAVLLWLNVLDFLESSNNGCYLHVHLSRSAAESK